MPRWLIDFSAHDANFLSIVDVIARATALLCLAAAIAMTSRRWSAAVRHRLWCLALCGLLVVPILSLTLPGWRLRVLPATLGLPGISASGAIQRTIDRRVASYLVARSWSRKG